MTLSYDDFKYLLGYQDSDNFLVRNIFAEGTERAKTCKEFLSSIVFEDLDHESLALMPFFLSHNGNAVTGGNLNMRIRGIHKWSMCKNSLNLSGILPLLKAYEKAGIPAMLLKGIVLAHNYYKGLGLRMMEDIDLAVPPEYFAKAAGIAEQMGFQGKDSGHSIDFCKDGKYRLDLHRIILKESYRNERREDIIWQRAIKINFYGLQVFVPRPEDMLLGLWLHEFFDIVGNEGQKGRNKKWVLDTKMILTNTPEFDWQGFIASCYHFRVMPQIICMLTFYRDLSSCNMLAKQETDALLAFLRKDEEYNKSRMRVFATMIFYLQKSFLFHYQKIYCTYLYITGKTLEEGIDYRGYKNYLYARYQADGLPSYLLSEGRQFGKRLRRLSGAQT